MLFFPPPRNFDEKTSSEMFVKNSMSVTKMDEVEIQPTSDVAVQVFYLSSNKMLNTSASV